MYQKALKNKKKQKTKTLKKLNKKVFTVFLLVNPKKTKSKIVHGWPVIYQRNNDLKIFFLLLNIALTTLCTLEALIPTT